MSGFGLDPGRQAPGSPKHDSSGGADSRAEQRHRVAVVDAQGCEHCGQAILSQDWHPQLGQLADDDFCIVILSERPTGSLGPIAAGVAVCAPGEAIHGGLRLRETATAYKVRERGRQAPDSEETFTLSASAMSALAGGQLLANQLLEISPADIFPPHETAPRLGLLAQALLNQRAVQPYLHALAVALAAPADAAPDVGLAELLPALCQALAQARWDLVISDHNMPGFSGSRALSIVHGQAPGLPFLFVSANPSEETLADDQRLGVSRSFIKGKLAGLGP
ncbi:MAG: response regulator, partial [Dehalococcoidia bacterium]